MKNSNYTGRAPRTMKDAFGQYTSRSIIETKHRVLAHEIALYIVAVIAVIVVLAVCK